MTSADCCQVLTRNFSPAQPCFQTYLTALPRYKRELSVLKPGIYSGRSLNHGLRYVVLARPPLEPHMLFLFVA